MAMGFIIDTLQAGISAAIAAVAANAGTVGGAALGCAAGAIVAGATGCAVGGAIFGFFGSSLNLVSGPALIPIGIMFALVITFAISLSFGTMLVVLLVFMGMFYPGQVLTTYFADFIPVLPGWTTLAVRAARRKNKEERLHLHAQTA